MGQYQSSYVQNTYIHNTYQIGILNVPFKIPTKANSSLWHLHCMKILDVLSFSKMRTQRCANFRKKTLKISILNLKREVIGVQTPPVTLYNSFPMYSTSFDTT